ncbi:TAP-like protein-domain-containing protein [Mycena crocata]|nr:TAP-like protein-domain-containing protein [Mycena crocata]
MFQCTKLEVPLDYSNSSVGTAALAVIRLPANVSKEEYRGPLLGNPGGPGNSGINEMVQLGPSFQAIFGKQYDIVSFDPRGVSYSTPTASFFESDAERALWNAGGLPILSLNASSTAIQENWARAQLLGQLAAQRDTTGILKFMTTDNVARDMLRITEKFGFEKLLYYGVSYGSYLGEVFATMFPDKIERLLLDGVVDGEAWLSGDLTIEATDTDKVLQAFFDSCAAAGPDLCAFYKSTAAEIENRLDMLTASIRAQPVPAISNTSHGVVDYSLLRQTIHSSLYTPYTAFAPLASSLAALERGDGIALYEFLGQSSFQCDCSNDKIPFHNNTAEVYVAVHCGDAIEVTDSPAQLQEYYTTAVRTSQFADILVGQSRVECSGWRIHREDRFNGPVTANKTSFPLLLVTTSADPVTPAISAANVQARFPGSGLFTQDSPGHASVTTPSLCTFNYFRQYFQNGTLPEPGTVCPVEATLFGAPGNSTAARRASLSADEMVALDAMKIIGDVIRPNLARRIGK